MNILKKIDEEVLFGAFTGSKEQITLTAIAAKYERNLRCHAKVLTGDYIPGSGVHNNILTYGEDCYKAWADSNVRHAQKVINNFPGLVLSGERLSFKETEALLELF